MFDSLAIDSIRIRFKNGTESPMTNLTCHVGAAQPMKSTNRGSVQNQDTVKLGYNEQLRTDHFCWL